MYDIARSYGWTLTARRNHATYEISCPEGACTEVVFSTGKGAENFAKRLTKIVRRCSHNTVITTSLAEADALLDEAQLLLNAVEECLIGLQMALDLENRIDNDEKGQDIEALLQAVELKERGATEALAVLTSSGDAREAVVDAEDKVTRARESVNGLDRENKMVVAAWGRCKELRDTASSFRQRLDFLHP